MNPVLIVLPILTVLMFDLGLSLDPRDFKVFIKRPWPVVAGLLGQIVLLPLVALIICILFRPDPVVFMGVMLVACAPGGSSSNIFSKIAGGDVALSVSLTAISSVITVFTIPVIVQLGMDYAGFAQEKAIEISAGKILLQNIVLMLLPIIAGIFLRKFRENTAVAIDRVLSRAAFPLLMLVALIFFIQHSRVIAENIASTGIMLLLLIFGAMLAAQLLSRVLGLNLRERKTVLIEVGMQNAAQSIALASSPFALNNAEMAVPAIIYALIMNVVLLVFVKLY